MSGPMCGCGGSLVDQCGCDADDVALCAAMRDETAARDAAIAAEVLDAVEGLFGPYRLGRPLAVEVSGETFDTIMDGIARSEGLMGSLMDGMASREGPAWDAVRGARSHLFAAALLVRSARSGLGLPDPRRGIDADDASDAG